ASTTWAIRWGRAPPNRGTQALAIDVTTILAGLLARNRGPDPLHPDRRQPPNYGVAASLEGNVLSMVLTFRKGSAYCCMEWGCHLPLTNGKRWDGLRRA